MSTKVFVLAEVCLPRRPHAVLSRSQLLSEKRKWRRTWKANEYLFSFKHQTEVGLHADVSEDKGLDREPPSLSPHFLLLSHTTRHYVTSLGPQASFTNIT